MSTDTTEPEDTKTLHDESGPDPRRPVGRPVERGMLGIQPPGYLFISVLGSGGMGIVFLARQEQLDRLVAVKMLGPEHNQHGELRQRLQREALTLSGLRHPNIVTCHDILEHSDRLFLVMEYVPGNLSVRDILRRHGPVPEPVAVSILLQTAKALAYARERGVIHRDIKPDNLLIFLESDVGPETALAALANRDLRIVLVDFGIAKGESPEQGDPEVTQSGTVVGSPAYMSPEQALGRPVDHRTDMYALGITLYQMLCNEVPFQDASPMAGLSRKLTQGIPAPRRLDGGRVTRDCLRILQRLTAPDPEERYPDYGRLIRDLERLSTLHRSRQVSPLHLFRYRSAPWRLVFAGAMLILLLTALTGIWTELRARLPRTVALSSGLTNWVGAEGWQLRESDDEHAGSPALTSAADAGPIVLRTPLETPADLDMDIRIPGAGEAVVSLLDDEEIRWTLTLTRTAEKGLTLRCVAEGRPQPVLEPVTARAPEWRHLSLRVTDQQIVLYVDDQLSGRTSWDRPVHRFVVLLDVAAGPLVQFQDLRARSTRPRTE